LKGTKKKGKKTRRRKESTTKTSLSMNNKEDGRVFCRTKVTMRAEAPVFGSEAGKQNTHKKVSFLINA
jgi:hypothetical protein